ncbi:MAG: NINE protein [Terriglobales bacterium]
MTAEVCPYCRASIAAEEPCTICSGCGTKHHQDCYEENGGCTIFGCSCAPAEEPKLSVSGPDLAAVGTPATSAASIAVAAPPAPPPPPPHDPVPPTIEELREIANRVVPSMFNSFAGDGGQSSPEPAPIPPTRPKSRTTFILLGALLGTFGAHNFYAGYRNKAFLQLALTLLTLGFGSPMSWLWAIIDICTVTQDRWGVQFES